MLHTPWNDIVIKLYIEKCWEDVEDVMLVYDNNHQEEETKMSRLLTVYITSDVQNKLLTMKKQPNI